MKNLLFGAAAILVATLLLHGTASAECTVVVVLDQGYSPDCNAFAIVCVTNTGSTTQTLGVWIELYKNQESTPCFEFGECLEDVEPDETRCFDAPSEACQGNNCGNNLTDIVAVARPCNSGCRACDANSCDDGECHG